MTNTRAITAKLAMAVIDGGRSLDRVLQHYFEQHALNEQTRGQIQSFVYGLCRWYGDLDQVAEQLLDKPIRKKDRIVHFLLLTGLYQLREQGAAEHAAVSETVAAASLLNKAWAKNLLNACLRTYQRNTDRYKPTRAQQSRNAHPHWLVDAIESAYPEQATAIFMANNQPAPMSLRVNAMQSNRADYLTELKQAGIGAQADQRTAHGIVLDRAVNVSQLPGFAQGKVSVQDSAAQIAIELLDVKAGQTILDACAAPGGKTAHMLELCGNNAQVDALEIDADRSTQLRATLNRLQLDARVFVTDARQCDWPAPSQGYDRILVDAPCTGSGVIRRHPDIRHHKQPQDLTALTLRQAQILDNVWGLLKPDGRLMYTTCSILAEENQQQMQRFILHQTDARIEPLPHPQSIELALGRQTLPGIHDMDGFYYCLLRKAHHAQH